MIDPLLVVQEIEARNGEELSKADFYAVCKYVMEEQRSGSVADAGNACHIMELFNI